MNPRYIGVDLGSTSMKMGIVNQDGKILEEREEPTLGKEGSTEGIQRLIRSVRDMVEQVSMSWDEITGIGVGLPGFLDIPNGKIIHLTNLGWISPFAMYYKLHGRSQSPSTMMRMLPL
ncbi:ROK family protein [Hazenella coriacea]|uniref:ROK family protein n=1 Tax=Hazenella coriacea TaxID=1179467 RepID=A0A4R3LBM1_9BACL|nr:ROK family protein [Hazenella coriacea]TCS95704.1 ROK family protein [Hazenella coriacea]